jgi:5-methylcytosine-specific restriction endonuclease McrA
VAPKRAFIELTFHATYYYADIVETALKNPSEFGGALDFNEFHSEERHIACIAPFQRFSALHHFISFIIVAVMDEGGDLFKLDLLQDAIAQAEKDTQAETSPPSSKLPIELDFDTFDIEHESFESWLRARNKTFLDARKSDMREYYGVVRAQPQFVELVKRATAEVFYIMFPNRQALLLFNKMMADQIKHASANDFANPECDRLFARPGGLRRVAIPSWVQRAVFFRDRGVCAICQRDLSGLLSVSSEENYDHVVPLAAGGLNDVSNIQLLCRECNASKQAGRPVTSNRYEAWYTSA